MMSGATLMVLFFLWPSTSARCGGMTRSTFGVGLPRLPQYLPLSTSTRRATGRGLADHLQARASNSGYFFQATPEHASKIAESLEALTSLRGGEGSDEVSVLTLLVRVFLPSFRRESEVTKGVLDLEGGGLMRRISRLMSGILRNVRGFAGSTDAKDVSGTGAGTGAGAIAEGGKKGKGKGKGKGKQATDSHLQTTYRPGNANYRIQKELKEFLVNPPDGCKVSVGKNIRVWIITISGAEGTIYAGEKFRLRVAFPEDYPTKPPAVYFLQSPPPPKHQHIYTNGDICLSLLSSRDWKPNLTVMSLALSILSMLSSAKEKRIPEDNAAHADSRPGQAQQWIYHDDMC